MSDEIIDDDESAVTCEFEVANMIEATMRHFGEIKPYSKPGIYKGEMVYLPPEFQEQKGQNNHG